MTDDLAKQTRNAFDFIEKLYFEVSYLIKEIEGLLAMEEEQFQILKPSGYGVTTRNSVGLDPVNVEQWLRKNLTVFFCPATDTATKGGQTITPLKKDLKVLFVHIKLVYPKGIDPLITFGVLENITSKRQENKFEKLTFEFAYSTDKVLKNQHSIDFEDTYCTFKGKQKTKKLFSLRNSDDVYEEIVLGLLKMYRG